MSNRFASDKDPLFCRSVDQGRRHFMKINIVGLACLPAASLLVSEPAAAGRTARHAADQSPEMLDPNDPQARALRYMGESPKTEQLCSNCQLYTGTEGDDYGPCAIFSYRVAPSGERLMVEAGGWCRAWGPRQKL
jgi:hypothetical protein